MQLTLQQCACVVLHATACVKFRLAHVDVDAHSMGMEGNGEFRVLIVKYTYLSTFPTDSRVQRNIGRMAPS